MTEIITLKQLVEKIAKINLGEMKSCYERYSYLYDCEQQANKYDRELLDLSNKESKRVADWVEQVLAFGQTYKPNADVLSYMKVARLFDDLSQKVGAECERRAKEFDARFQKVNALPRGAQLLSDGKAFLADWRKQPAPVEGYCKVVTKKTIAELESKLGVEAVYFGAEETITALEKTRVKGNNTADWCAKVEDLEKQYTAAQLKACRNYALYCELKDDAAFSRKVIRCQAYLSALGKDWYFENVYELNGTLSVYQADLRTVLPDFDKKWQARFEEAKAAAKVQAEKWLKEGLQKQKTPEGFALFQKAAKYGNVAAYAEIGYSYNFARGVEQDVKQAALWIEKAIDNGMQEGYYFYLLGHKYEQGNGVGKNVKKAFELYQKGDAAPHGSGFCYKPLGYCYLNGVGVNKNWKLAYEYFLKYLPVESNLANAATEYYWLGYLKENAAEVGVDEHAALEWYEQASKYGNEEGRKNAKRLQDKFERCASVLSLIEAAQKKSATLDFEKAYDWDGKMSTYLAEFKSQIPDFETKWKACMTLARTIATQKAEEWFNQAYSDKNETRRFTLMQKSAQYGNLKAYGELAYYYSFGLGTAQNQNASVQCLEKAIGGGLQDGYFYYLLGNKCEHGLGTAQNTKRAFDLYKKGETMQNRGVCCEVPLAYCYLNGVGTGKDLKTAYAYFMKYATREQNSANAAAEYYWIGYLKETASEVGKDERAALEWYEKAEKYGNADGKKHAKRLRDKFARIDLDNRIDICYARAVKGDVAAMDELGEYYYTGNGVTQSYKEAVEWFEKAAKKGNAHAIERLGDCYYYGQGVKQSYGKAEKYYKLAAKKG